MSNRSGCNVGGVDRGCRVCRGGRKGCRPAVDHAAEHNRILRSEGWFDVPIARPVADSGGPVAGNAGLDPGTLKAMPTLHGFIYDAVYDDGTARRTGTLLLFAEDGVLKAYVNDRDNGRGGWVSGPSLMETFKLIDSKLSTGTMEWRTDQSKKGKR